MLRINFGGITVLSRTLTPGFPIAVLLCLVLGTGCGGGTNTIPESGGGHSAAIPAPAACRLVAAEADDVNRDGAEHLVLPDFPVQHVSDHETSAIFAPDWTADGRTNAGLAFACYSFILVDFDESNRVELVYSLAGDATDCWVGLADWAGDCWDWYPTTDWSVATDFTPYINSETNQLLVLVLLTGDSTWRLEEVCLGGVVALDGYVYGDDGTTPVEAVQISLDGGLYEVFRYDFTDENGYWRIEGIADGDYTVTPSKYSWGFDPVERPVAVAGAAVTVDPFIGGELPLVDIDGYIYLDDGETPVGDCSVQLSGGTGWRTVTTNSAGRYILEDTYAGEYEVYPVDLRYTYDPESRTVDAQADTTVDPFTASPIPLYNVDGYELMNDGTTPISGVEVVVFSYVPAGTTFTATTDASGYWTMAGIPPYSFFVSPYKDGYDFDPVSTMIVVEDHDVTVETIYGTCPAHYVVDGYVYGDDGVTPVEGVPVLAECAVYTFEAVTDAAGYWVMPEVFEETYVITPLLAPWSFDPRNRTVTVLGGDVTVDPFLGTELPSSTVDGYIYEEGGATPVENISVTFRYDTLYFYVPTDSTGHYEINLPYGSWEAVPVAGCWDFDPVSRIFVISGSPVTLDPFYAIPGG